MFLARVSMKNAILRHGVVAFLSSLIVLLFLLLRLDFPLSSNLSRALAEASFVLLVATMLLGPLGRLYPPLMKWITWRRETGIWFAVFALLHFVASNLNGFELLRQGREVPMILGYIALAWGILLATISSDKAIAYFGSRQWKWLQTMAYVIFYTVSIHVAFNMFWAYQDQKWLPYFFIILAVSVPTFQLLAFIDEVGKYRKKQKAG